MTTVGFSWCSGDLPLDFHDIHLKYRYFEGEIRRLFHYMNILDMVLLFLPVEDNELPLKMRREINQISHWLLNFEYKIDDQGVKIFYYDLWIDL